MRRLAVVLTLVLATLLPGVPAWAHATLQEATPADTAVLARSPAEVTLRYDEPVSTALGAVTVLAPDGSRVDAGPVEARDGGRTVAAALDPDLPAGTYTVLWRVLSVDNHTIFGTTTFSVGAPGAAAGGAAVDQQAGGRAAEDLLTGARLLLYAGLVLLVGGLAFLLVVWPAGRAVPASGRLLRAGLLLAVAATVAGLLLQGPYAAGLPLAAALDPALAVGVLSTGYGVAGVVRLVLLAGLAALLRGLPGLRGPRAVAAGVLAVGTLVSTSAVGHAAAGDLVAVTLPADVVHLAAASAWLGGLAQLGVVVLRGDHPTALLPRWSRHAAAAVGLLVVTGLVAAYAHVREWGALTGTAYGRLLLVKTVLVAAMLVLAALGRAWVQRRAGAPAADPAAPAPGPHAAADPGPGDGAVLTRVRPAPTPARLRRSVLVEAGLAVAVLAVTALLVDTTPARNDWFPPVAVSAPVAGDLQVQVDVDPARRAGTALRLTYTAGGGRPTEVVRASARWVRQEGGDDVVPVTLLRSGPGRWSAGGIVLPAAGTWQLAVVTQTSDVDATTSLFAVHVR